MKIGEWDERYRTGDRSRDGDSAPNSLVAETAAKLKPGKALDLACGSGRNAIWLAEHGWRVTAIDGAAAAIDILRGRAAERGVDVEARVADLERDEYRIEANSWDLILMCFYLQKSLFGPVKQGLRPGGVVLAIVHISQPGETPTEHQLRPGELLTQFAGWRVLHSYEGPPHDPAHKRACAEIVAIRPRDRQTDR